MSKTLCGLFLVLLLFGEAAVARADSDPLASYNDALRQCLAASTLDECRAALPACASVMGALTPLTDPKLDTARERLLNDWIGCEKQLGQYEQAEAHLRSLLALRIRLYGNAHPVIALSLTNLAQELDRQGKYAEAEVFHRQTLQLLRKFLGAEHLAVAMNLNALAYVLDRQGKYAEAETIHREALQMRQKLLHAEHSDIAQSLNNLAHVLERQGKYAEAETYYRQALQMWQKLLGAEHLDVAFGLNNLATVLYSQGKYVEAETLQRQTLQMRQKLLGAEHADVALSMSNLASLLDRQGRYSEAETLNRRALQMRQKLLEAEHPDVASSLNNLACGLDNQGKYAEAETMHRQALQMRQKLLGTEHPDVALSMSNLSLALYHQGKYPEAETLERQSVQLRQRLFGPEHPDVALSMSNLAAVLKHQGKYAEAEGLYRKSLQMRQKLLGSEHPDVAVSLNNLASGLDSQGKYAEAEMLYRQALGMSQKLMRADHPVVAQVLDNLAAVLDRRGKYAEAEVLFRQALQIQRKVLGDDHPDTAATLNNLAHMLQNQGKYVEAETLFRKALKTLQNVLAADHPSIATSMDNLAAVLSYQGKYPSAEAFHYQALQLRQKIWGTEHVDVAISLDNLAALHFAQKKYAQAEVLNQQALKIFQRLMGDDHPEVAMSLFNLATDFLAQAAVSKALPRLRQSAAIREAQLRATVSETRMQALIDTLRDEEDAIYGLLLGPPLPDLVPLALTTALLRKGRVAEAGAAANRLLHSNLASPDTAQRFSDWQALRAQREALLYSGPGALAPTEYTARLQSLKTQAESLEYLLAAELPDMRTLQPPGFNDILPAVARHLSRDSVLVEVVWTRPYQPGTREQEARWGAAHYVGMLLFPDQQIVTYDLGAAATVDMEVQRLRSALESSDGEPAMAAKALFERVLGPLLAHLRGRTHLYLSLDGMLNEVPFDALHDGTDYLLGRWRFHYLTSGRDLLREPSKRAPGAPLLLANPDFGNPEKALPKDRSGSLYERLQGLRQLPGTQAEAERLKPLFRVEPLLRSAATELSIRQAHAPRILHIATHGLFLHDVDLPASAALARGLRSATNALVRSKLALLAPNLYEESLPGEMGAMNRSALALAGVLQGHRSKDTARDGLLTAEEARSLDLDGTQLVTLSACETGRGGLSAGQGVYGLRRAFLVAGAETLVTSLWRVSDDATGELMARYYAKLLDKRKPGDRLGAMLEAMQELRARPGRSHPYYWAPFLVIGQDGPLRP